MDSLQHANTLWVLPDPDTLHMHICIVHWTVLLLGNMRGKWVRAVLWENILLANVK